MIGRITKRTHNHLGTDFIPDKRLFHWFGQNLPSAKNYFVTDIDLVLRNRIGNVSYMMLLEVKRKKRNVKKAQAITIGILNEALKKVTGTAVKVKCLKYPIQLEYCGAHLLQFENTWFNDGKVYFDYQEISETELIKILSFETLLNRV